MKLHHAVELNESLKISDLKQNKIFKSLPFQYDLAYSNKRVYKYNNYNLYNT